jgi:hypothetical protein
MPNTIRIKRSTGSSAPTSLANAELAYAEGADALYVGVGTGGAGGTATVVRQIGGGLWSAKTANTIYAGPATGSAATPTFRALVAADIPTHGHAVSDVTGLQTALDSKAASVHSHAIGDVTNLQTSLNAKADLASPTFTGTPSAPTAVAGTNSTQIATTAFVSAAVNALINGAPGALDTLQELAAALGSDASFSTTITNSLAGKLTASSNLSDVASVSTARTNLGLGTMATQAASNVNITGGAIDNITIDGGTYT